MPSLASCYFCGAAVDARVREYRPSPPSGGSTTVSLCSGCRRKAETLLDGIVDDPIEFVRADHDGASERTQREDEGPDDRLDPHRAETDRPSESDLPRDGGSSDDPSVAVDDGRNRASTSDDGITIGEGSGDAVTDSALSSGRTEIDDSADEGAEIDDSADEAGDPPHKPEDVPDHGIDRPPAKTYNQVVRLLQNREFPVDRSEFEQLAVAAYELGREEVEHVLDYAVASGALDEGEGELRRPEG